MSPTVRKTSRLAMQIICDSSDPELHTQHRIPTTMITAMPARQKPRSCRPASFPASALLAFLLLPSSHAYLMPRVSKSADFSNPPQHRYDRAKQRPLTGASFPSSSVSVSPLAVAAISTTASTTNIKRELVGASKFVRQNPQSDRFKVLNFHHVEFYCGDATNTYRRFQLGLGMNLVAKSDLSTGNSRFASYCLRSNNLQMVFTAPYSMSVTTTKAPTPAAAVAVANGDELERDPNPGFDSKHATDFFTQHGVAVRAIGLEVEDATKAYTECIAHGGQAVLEPVRLVPAPMSGQRGYAVMSEVRAYGDVVLRFVSKHEGYAGSFLPAYTEEDISPLSSTSSRKILDYGLERIDHAVGNVWELLDAVGYIGEMTGFHPFAEFVAEDVGTIDSGLNSIVLANNAEDVLLPLNEPTYGTKRQSQIQTYLECNKGPGVQHLALATKNIFSTMRKMRAVSEMGGFSFMAPPPPSYYRALPERLEGALTHQQLEEVEELGLLADKDDQGVLLQVGKERGEEERERGEQGSRHANECDASKYSPRVPPSFLVFVPQIFTLPVGDRPTLFLEIIQRIGCETPDPSNLGETIQKGGCGGFGKGNFAALFKSIEEYEKKLNV